MGALIRMHDWAATPLGPVDTWPQSLRTAVALMIRTRQPTYLAWGPDHISLYNDGYIPILGGKHPASLGQPAAVLWSEIWETLGPLNAAVLAGNSHWFEDMPFALAGRDREQSWFSFSYTPLLDDEGMIAGIYCVATETTDKVIAERRFRESEASLRQLNETLEQQVAERTQDRDRIWINSQDILIIVDEDGVFRSVNPAFQAILGWSPDEVVGKSVFAFILPDDDASARTLGRARTEIIRTFENRYRHKDGSIRWISWVGAPENGFIYGSGRDITAEREQVQALQQAEEALRQSQKMEVVGQLTGGVAHDFNNLLTVIKSSTDLLKRPDLAEERRARYVNAISDTVDRAAKLTAQLLAFARRQTLNPEVFAACDSVRAISDMMGTLTGARIEIVTHLPEDRCFVHADASQFDTALVNMVVNARDAMDGQGRLTISVQTVEQMPAIRGHEAVAGQFAAISITDTGSGISPENLERIFEPFFTTKGVGQGTGLGLSQVFGFAKQSGGEVAVTSVVDHGTTFTLYLPRVAAPAVGAEADTSEPEPLVDGHGTCVLVVEDNTDVGAFATQTLAELGYTTVWAASGDEALAELAKNADRFDVVFSDVVMPGMSGIELAQAIRRDHHDLPVVLTSGYSHVLVQNGTYGFELLRKPYSVEQLSRILRKVATWQRRKHILSL